MRARANDGSIASYGADELTQRVEADARAFIAAAEHCAAQISPAVA